MTTSGAARTDGVRESRAWRCGRTISVSDVDVHDDQGRLCALGRGTYSSLVG